MVILSTIFLFFFYHYHQLALMVLKCLVVCAATKWKLLFKTSFTARQIDSNGCALNCDFCKDTFLFFPFSFAVGFFFFCSAFIFVFICIHFTLNLLCFFLCVVVFISVIRIKSQLRREHKTNIDAKRNFCQIVEIKGAIMVLICLQKSQAQAIARHKWRRNKTTI